MASTPCDESYHCQLRLLLEEICCDLAIFHHVTQDGCPPECVRIDREFNLGGQETFADIRVVPAQEMPYFMEIKFGYSEDRLLRHLRRKYGPDSLAGAWGTKLLLVHDGKDPAQLAAEIGRFLNPRLTLEMWDEEQLLTRMRSCFRTECPKITAEDLLDIREAIDRAKGCHAFDIRPQDYQHDPLKAELLWHFGFWRLRQLLDAGRNSPRAILPPGNYRGVVVVMADLCSFSSYVRDTPDGEIVRESLTSFYSKARYQIINSGGLLYQFVGDEVIGFFGLPEATEGYETKALETARALLDIGESVAHHWQRRIDRIQEFRGVHVGMAVGELEIVSLRPFSRTHMGAIGDCINVAARLMACAGQGEIAVSNSYHQLLPEELQGDFQELDAVEARNVGRIKAWKLPAAADRRKSAQQQDS